jgi:uncharacterized protein (DUF983 family)
MNNMLKGTKLYSIAANKCPSCQEGDFFIYKNPYNLKKFDKMNDSCQVCHADFEKEPGFYQGAMYVNYALSIATGIGWFLLVYLMYGFDPFIFMISFSVLLILLLPLMFRIGRLLWINLFVKYSKDRKLNNL